MTVILYHIEWNLAASANWNDQFIKSHLIIYIEEIAQENLSTSQMPLVDEQIIRVSITCSDDIYMHILQSNAAQLYLGIS